MWGKYINGTVIKKLKLIFFKIIAQIQKQNETIISIELLEWLVGVTSMQWLCSCLLRWHNISTMKLEIEKIINKQPKKKIEDGQLENWNSKIPINNNRYF